MLSTKWKMNSLLPAGRSNVGHIYMWCSAFPVQLRFLLSPPVALHMMSDALHTHVDELWVSLCNVRSTGSMWMWSKAVTSSCEFTAIRHVDSNDVASEECCADTVNDCKQQSLHEYNATVGHACYVPKSYTSTPVCKCLLDQVDLLEP